jgi:ubiquinone/menaquinone biosynthesis C-methylase UbiE
MAFHDHFSGHAADYARFRPRYPEALFADLAARCSLRSQAWDCGTGNGQAAVGLARYFDRVIATDASSRQIAEAEPHPNVSYHVCSERDSGLPDESVDLVTVAQALHWFDRDAFFAEARRVLKPCGIIAVWCYDLHHLGDPFDAVLQRFYDETVGPYWPPERALVEQEYRTIEFPFEEFLRPVIHMEHDLSLEDLLNYLSTWSATKRFIQARGDDPLPQLERELVPLWGDRSQRRRVIWPLAMRIGRKECR